MPRTKKYKPPRGQFKLPSDKPPRPAPEAVYKPHELCEECNKPLSQAQIRAGRRCCSYKCSNRRKARAVKGRPRSKPYNLVVSKRFKPHTLAEISVDNDLN